MDIIDACKVIIRDKLNELDKINEQSQASCEADNTATQNVSYTQDAGASETDRNLTRILNQQAYLKRMIDQDNQIQLLRESLKTIVLEIEGLRKSCTRMNQEALKARQDLVTTQAKEIERFQMAQIRSISEDYTRHQVILEQRKKEIQSLKKEIEREEKDRGAYLLDVEKKLEKQLQDRQKSLRGGALPFGLLNQSSVDDELHNPHHLELTSVDEYAPYGSAPHSRSNARGGRGRGRGASGTRAKRGRRGA